MNLKDAQAPCMNENKPEANYAKLTGLRLQKDKK